MCPRVLLTVQLALLVATSGVEEEVKLWVFKCCPGHEMLSADGGSCVEANWLGNFSIKTNKFGHISPPLDSVWVQHWLPPGLPTEYISFVYTNTRQQGTIVSRVNASSLWDPALLGEEDLWKSTVVFVDDVSIAWPRPGGGVRKASYCVDAAPPPLGPFVMRRTTYCSGEECARKCCMQEALLKANSEGKWQCKFGAETFWTPEKSSLAVFDSEFPWEQYELCQYPRLLPFEQRYVEWARHTAGSHRRHFSTLDTCFDFYRIGNESLREGVFSCEYPRITRGVYWLLRPLCFLSTLLLTVSLISVACDKSMRRKIHGRCLASHAACLWAFNIGQTVYYNAISDHLVREGKDDIPRHLQKVCKYFALSMYFVQTAAWFWLTALCLNMAMGFRLHITHLNKRSGKKFLVISAFAWGLPALLTIACSILFTQPKSSMTHAWYTPSLMETRVCFIERLFYGQEHAIHFIKSGTALFYYGPVFCLVICNIVCLVVTLKKVKYLKKGNSVLRREEDQIPLGQRHAEGNNPPTAHTATGSGRTRGSRGRSGTTVDAKTIKLYIKIILTTGGIELLSEIVMWSTTVFNGPYRYYEEDLGLAYRAAGYVTDFFRAAVVTWLAAPEGGYMGLIMRMLRRDREKKSPGAGNAGRRKQNVA